MISVLLIICSVNTTVDLKYKPELLSDLILEIWRLGRVITGGDNLALNNNIPTPNPEGKQLLTVDNS